jgi:hypothetical protein
MCEPVTLGLLTSAAVGGGAAAGALGASAAALTTAQTVMLALSAGSAVMGAAGAYQQSQASKAVAENNAHTAGVQAEDAIRRGDLEAQNQMRQSRQMVGAQRAAYSARGLDISTGTPSDVIEQTDFFGQSDAATARTNARKEAWAYRTQQAGFQGEASAQNPMMAATASLLGSAGSVANKWYSFSKG